MAKKKAAKKKARVEVKKRGKCEVCAKPASENEFCYGCRAYFCDECPSAMELPFGGHSVTAHADMVRQELAERGGAA